MRTVEREKLRNAMKEEKVRKVNKHLKTWYKAYLEKKHEYLQKKREAGYTAETRREYEKRLRSRRGA